MLPFDAGTAIDATLHDDLLYVTTWRSFSIYDVSDPLDPQPLGVRHTPGQLLNEEPDTNGDILLLSHDQQPAAELHVWDVRYPRSPDPITEFATRTNQHMFTCVLDCAYVYGARGAIIDLRDPSAPIEVGDWTTVAPYEGRLAHAIEEVAPGIVMTGSYPGHVLDAREDPATRPCWRPTARRRTVGGPSGSDPRRDARARGVAARDRRTVRRGPPRGRRPRRGPVRPGLHRDALQRELRGGLWRVRHVRHPRVGGDRQLRARRRLPAHDQRDVHRRTSSSERLRLFRVRVRRRS